MANKVKNSAVNPGKGKAQLDHWYGWQQSVGTGISTDPERKGVEPGVLKSGQFLHEGNKKG